MCKQISGKWVVSKSGNAGFKVESLNRMHNTPSVLDLERVLVLTTDQSKARQFNHLSASPVSQSFKARRTQP